MSEGLLSSPNDPSSAVAASLQRSLQQRSALKVIAGLMNFDAASVERVARAAGRGGADLIDVACDPALVRLAIEVSGGVPVRVVGGARAVPSSGGSRCAHGGDRQLRRLLSPGRIFDAAEVLSSPACAVAA